jgi:phage gpG-like protein
MNLVIQLDSLEGFGESLMAWAEKIKSPVQVAMAAALLDITLGNFGESSPHRTVEWLPLRQKYANKFHDGDTTPTEILSGELMASYKVDIGDADAARVYSDCPYAADQHNGVDETSPYKVSIPPRPVLPVDESGEPDVYAQALIRGAAEAQIAEMIPK